MLKPHYNWNIVYGKGISKTGCILDLAVSLDIVNKAGAWFSYGDIRLGQGRDASKQFLAANPEIYNEIEAKIRANLTTTSVSEQPSFSDAEDDFGEE